MLDDLLVAVLKTVQFVAEQSAGIYHWLRSADTEHE